MCACIGWGFADATSDKKTMMNSDPTFWVPKPLSTSLAKIALEIWTVVSVGGTLLRLPVPKFTASPQYYKLNVQLREHAVRQRRPRLRKLVEDRSTTRSSPKIGQRSSSTPALIIV